MKPYICARILQAKEHIELKVTDAESSDKEQGYKWKTKHTRKTVPIGATQPISNSRQRQLTAAGVLVGTYRLVTPDLAATKSK